MGGTRSCAAAPAPARRFVLSLLREAPCVSKQTNTKMAKGKCDQRGRAQGQAQGARRKTQHAARPAGIWHDWQQPPPKTGRIQKASAHQTRHRVLLRARALLKRQTKRSRSSKRNPITCCSGAASSARVLAGIISYQVNVLRLLRQSRWPFARTTS